MSQRANKIVLLTLAVLAGAGALSLRWFRANPERLTTTPRKKLVARSATVGRTEPTARNTTAPTLAQAWEELAKNGPPQLSPEQLRDYLELAGRDAASLIVASRLAKDSAYLFEAAAQFPEDPLVQLEVALSPDATPEDKRLALEAFRNVSPDNALGDYLSAHLAFSQGDYAAAANGLIDSMDHGALADFSEQILAGTEQAYRSTGLDDLTAQLAAMASLTRPTLTPLREVSQHLDGLKDEFIKAEDFDAAEPAVIIGLNLGQKIQASAPFLVDQLVGMSIERNFLVQLDPLTQAGPGGQTAEERLATLDQDRLAITTQTQAFAEVAPRMDAATAKEYFGRMRRDGELAAMKWAVAKLK